MVATNPDNSSSAGDGPHGAAPRSASEPISRQAQALLPLVYDELRRIAADYLRQDRADHTLQPTALVHEAFLKIARHSSANWRDESHFRAVAAMAMRQILVDHARGRNAGKRGGDRLRVTLSRAGSQAADGGDDAEFDLLALDEAMRELESIDERRAKVVELHFFGGLTFRDAAHVLNIAPKTAESDWYFARAWLRKRLAERP